MTTPFEFRAVRTTVYNLRVYPKDGITEAIILDGLNANRFVIQDSPCIIHDGAEILATYTRAAELPPTLWTKST